jgi:hypothetical protein
MGKAVMLASQPLTVFLAEVSEAGKGGVLTITIRGARAIMRDQFVQMAQKPAAIDHCVLDL